MLFDFTQPRMVSPRQLYEEWDFRIMKMYQEYQNIKRRELELLLSSDVEDNFECSDFNIWTSCPVCSSYDIDSHDMEFHCHNCCEDGVLEDDYGF